MRLHFSLMLCSSPGNPLVIWFTEPRGRRRGGWEAPLLAYVGILPNHQPRHRRRFYQQIDATSHPRNHGVVTGLLAGALVGIAMSGIPSSSRACGGQGRALHDGEVTRTPGRGGEPTGRRRREDMAAVSFTAAKSLAPPSRRSAPRTSLPLPVRHHSPLLPFPNLEQTNLA
jgi:hypothetical protein